MRVSHRKYALLLQLARGIAEHFDCDGCDEEDCTLGYVRGRPCVDCDCVRCMAVRALRYRQREERKG
jgi:hypothetical protein